MLRLAPLHAARSSGFHQIYAGCWQGGRKQAVAGMKSTPSPQTWRRRLKEASWYQVKATTICHLISQCLKSGGMGGDYSSVAWKTGHA